MGDSIAQFIRSETEESVATKQRLLADQDLMSGIARVAELAIRTYENGGKLMLAGNGGSAADAQHIAAELVNQLCYDRPALASVALTTDSSILTCVGNDRHFDQIFSRQVEANGRRGDLFIGISTSGNSSNVIRALEACAGLGIATVGWTGEGGGRMAELCDICLRVPSSKTPRIQECHIMIGHIVCSIIEDHFFQDAR